MRGIKKLNKISIKIDDSSKLNLNNEKNNINNLNLFNLLATKEKDITIIISMNSSENKLKRYIKKIIKYKKYLLKSHNTTIILQSFCENEIVHYQFRELLISICEGDKYSIYSKAYDLACDYLDSFFYGKNLCEFYNNRCGYKKDYDIEVGCCRHFEKHKHFGLLLGEKLVPCEYLGSNKRCNVKCLSCKLYTCPYLEKKGIKFKLKDIFPINSIFNWKQKIYIKSNVYTKKEDMLKVIMFLS